MIEKVCVQGLGFVGSAMAVAVASSRDEKKVPIFNVVGIDVDTQEGKRRIDSLNQGTFPFETTDATLLQKTSEASVANFSATTSHSEYSTADYVLISIPFNLTSVQDTNRKAEWEPFQKAISQVASKIKPSCLVVLETTVLPGTTRQKVLPIFVEEFEKRSISAPPLLAYSYERVMPGEGYFDSIINSYRCYAGINKKSADLCETFLGKVINTRQWPLTRLHSLEAAEMAKVMENSYRAVNIAFIEEWAGFSEEIGVNLNEVVQAIKMRNTHANIARPGFGVGGYCLTKDPLFAKQSALEIFNSEASKFPFCEMAVKTNQYMPIRCLQQLKNCLTTLVGKKILLAGISYKNDVGDTRHSPAKVFNDAAIKEGAVLTYTDPMVSYWEDLSQEVETAIDSLDPSKFDAVVFGVKHSQYCARKILTWLCQTQNTPLVFDACGLFSQSDVSVLKKQGISVYIIGYGKVK